MLFAYVISYNVHYMKKKIHSYMILFPCHNHNPKNDPLHVYGQFISDGFNYTNSCNDMELIMVSN